MIKLRNKGFVISSMLCCMLLFTGCSSVKDTLSLLMGTSANQEQEETDVNKNAYIVDARVQKPEITKNLGEPTMVYAYNAEAAPLTVECQVGDGGTLSYQWYSNNVDANGGGSVIEGATTNTFIPATNESGTAFYYVVITNNVNNHIQMVTSTTQSVTVEAAPAEPEVTPTDVPVTPEVTPTDVPGVPEETPTDVPVEPEVTPTDVPVEPEVTPTDVPAEPEATPTDAPTETPAQ